MNSANVYRKRAVDAFHFVLNDLNDANKRLQSALVLNGAAKHLITALTMLALDDIEDYVAIVEVIKLHILSVRIVTRFFYISSFHFVNTVSTKLILLVILLNFFYSCSLSLIFFISK